MIKNSILNRLQLPEEAAEILAECKSLLWANSIKDFQAFFDGLGDKPRVVEYDIAGKGAIQEAFVCKVKNGLSVNYCESYMRRRDPDSMLIGDDLPSDKVRFQDVYSQDFSSLREETFRWLKRQDLAAFVFLSGQREYGIPSIALVPANAWFFVFGLALLQGIVDLSKSEKKFVPRCFLYVAPPFRHIYFDGKQRVVHCRTRNTYEIFSYNLYPGPSAKKGVYGALLHFGEQEGWVTAHAAVVQVVTPYNIKVTIMHEGASGSGKSEMNEHIHREYDGSILFGSNLVTGEKMHFVIPKGCNLRPVTDDMALCHPSIQKNNGKLTVVDAENSWFIRVDHIKGYGTDPDIEARSIHPTEPLLFLNIDAQPNSTALLWDHVLDENARPCPNPRFVLPRRTVPDVIDQPVSIDIRSFGVRTPPCTREKPSYGILGVFHILPPAVAWLWRLVSPRGYDNPSITDSEGLCSEGIGSFWPFAAGLQTNFANLLLKQIVNSPRVQYILCPVQHIGSWSVGFVPEWIAREYLARRGGAHFSSDELSESSVPLLGYQLEKLIVEGFSFPKYFLNPALQPQVGQEAFDEGARILNDYFTRELSPFLSDALDPLGRKIIDCFLEGGRAADFEVLIDHESLLTED
ncbi:MAG: hypothetical protein A4E72_00225 [Syntrophus sp. PtaU1.Bin208]|nr:MAG: hypothetical protein A4E72_00225 [Syntrophus sp. PtaU1.Bin208]